MFATGIAIRPLGYPDQRNIRDSHLFKRFSRSTHLPLAAVDQHQIGPFPLAAVRVFLFRARKTAFKHFAHHREIIARSGIGVLDIEFAIVGFAIAFGPGHHHRAHCIGAGDMAIIVYLDPVGQIVELEQIRHFAHDLSLAR